MGGFIIILSFLLLIVGIPVALFLTIFFSVKKKKLSLWTLSIPAVIVTFVFMFLFGVIITPTSDEPETDQKVVVEESEEDEEESEVKENAEKEEKPKELTESEYKSQCQEYVYKDVMRNPEEYIGEKIVLTVEVSTVKSESFTNPTKYYFAYSESEPGSGYFYGDRYAIFDKRENKEQLKILEEDVIKVWGEISEPQETTSLIVNGEELFCINMKYVELISE